MGAAKRKQRSEEKQPKVAPSLEAEEDGVDPQELLDAEIDLDNSSDDEGFEAADHEEPDLSASDDDDGFLSDDDREGSASIIRKMLNDAMGRCSGQIDDGDDDFEADDADKVDNEDGSATEVLKSEEDWGHITDDGEEAPKERLMRPEIVPDTDSDDSDNEAHENTVGNVPMEWYNEYPHIGYNLDGHKILKPAVGDELDKFLSKMDDPNFWTCVHDKQDQKDVQLTEEELEIIQKLQKAEYAAEGFDPYQSTIEWFTSKTSAMPLSGAPEPKRRFLPSKWEHKKVMKIVRAIRKGWILPRKPKSEKPAYFDVWGADQEEPPLDNHPMHLPAPKQALPGHIASYNPPEEYLFNEEERKEWEEAEPSDRKVDFIPQKYDSLRKIPAYGNFIQERFQRCLDLYLCPRVRRNRVDVDPEALIPKLPDPKDLEPFPTSLTLIFNGHTHRIRTFAMSPSGQFVLSGSDDNTMRLWEVSTARCLHVWQFSEPVTCVAWNPNKTMCIAAATVGNDLMLINVGIVADVVAENRIVEHTSKLFSGEAATVADRHASSGTKLAPKCEWRRAAAKLQAQGCVWQIHHQKTLSSVTWHRKGDYFATVVPNGGAASVQIHQVSRKQSQQPFKRNKGLVIKVMFHQTRPHLLVATQRYVRVYDLQHQQLLKKLMSGVKWISSMDVHPGGESIIVGSYDKRLCWWDLELGLKPYKTLRYHKQALRSVAFHPQYPLFASASDDGTIQIFHGMVYNDMLTNPLIVPVKILRAHQPVESLGALNIQWHPTQPWIMSSGADGTMKLWM